jgi:selenide,water dikinase
MAVIGEVHPDRVWSNAGARPDDVLILTKPLGTGILTTAFKREMLGEEGLAPAVASMRMLNAGAARAGRGANVHAATDVTGFGLLGHLGNVLRASSVSAEVELGAVPLLPDARRLAEAGAVSGGTRRNLEAMGAVHWDPAISDVDRLLLCDAQTSGGLLFAVAPGDARALVEALGRERTLAAAVIGRITAGEPGTTLVIA